MYRYKIFSSYIALLLLLGQTLLQGQEFQAEISFYRAQHYEDFLGDLPQALKIYEGVLAMESAPVKLQAEVYLRIAFCYEKLGQDELAKKAYSIILSQYQTMPEFVRIAENRLRESQRRNQIIELKDELKKLQESLINIDIKNKYEAEIKKLQERIAALETSSPAREDAVPANEIEQQRISDALSANLYSIANNLYSQGHLAMAKESLEKALSFNTGNQKAIELIKKIEEELLQAKEKEKSSPPEEEKKNGSRETDEPEIEEEIKEVIYNELEEILKDGNPQTGRNNLLLLLKSHFSTKSFSPDAFQFAEGKLVVREAQTIQAQVQNLLQQIVKKPKVLVMRVTLISASPWILQKELSAMRLDFTQTEEGVLHASLPKEQADQLVFFARQEQRAAIYNFPNIAVINKNQTRMEKSFELPLSSGYMEKKPGFMVYQEGLRFIFDIDPIKFLINTNLTVKKIHRPMEEVPTAMGLLQVPFFLQQNANFIYEINARNSLLIMGLLNPLAPYIHHQKDHSQRLMMLVFFEHQDMRDFLARPLDPESQKNDPEEVYSIHYYSIEMWRKIPDLSLKGLFEARPNLSREEFIVDLCRRLVKNLPEKAIIKVIEDKLMVYAPQKIHEQIQAILNGLQQNQNFLQSFFVYLLSMPKDSVTKLLRNWRLAHAEEEKLQVHIIPAGKDIAEITKSFPEIKVENNFPSVIIGNTQNMEINDLRLRSFMGGISETENKIILPMMDYIPEGISIQLRPVIISPQENYLDVNILFYQMQSVRDVLYNREGGPSFSLNIPEMFTQKGNVLINCAGNSWYILTGFRSNKEKFVREYVFIIVPNPLEQDAKKK